MDSRRFRAPTGTAAFVPLLLVFAGTAFGATKSVNDCESVERELISLGVPQSTLSIQNVDHASDDTTPVGLDTDDGIDEIDNLGDVGAPILYLTPRVSDLLQEVFSGAKPADEPVGEITSSPVADSIEDSDSTGLSIDSDTTTDNEILPVFQQQMFRKDI